MPTASAIPIGVTACAQLCRFWSRRTALAGGLLFVEPDDSVKGNLYACPLPELRDRLATNSGVGVSVTPTAEQPPQGYDVWRSLLVEVEAHATTRHTAMQALGELRRLIRPSDQPFFHVQAHGGAFPLGGVIGLPREAFVASGGTEYANYADGGTISVWRVRQVDVVSEIRPVAVEFSGRATEDGQGSASMTIGLRGTVEDMPAPTRAFSLHQSGSAYGDVEVTGADAAAQLVLRRGTSSANITGTNTLNLNASATVDDLIAAVQALGTGWTVSDENPLAAFRSPLDGVPRGRIDASGAAKKRAFRVWA